MGIQLNGTSGTDVISAVDGSLTIDGDISVVDKIIHGGDTNTFIRFPAADTFAVETAGSERFRIASNGKIGIGTDNPSQKLEVLGTTNLFGNGGASVQWGDTSYVGHLSFSSDGAIIRSASGKALIFHTNHVNERFRISSDGKFHTGDPASLATDDFNITATGTGGTLSLNRAKTGNASDGDLLGALSFQSYPAGQGYASAEAGIRAYAATGQSGSAAPTELRFYTKPSSIGPGAGAPERLRITSDGKFSLGDSITAAPAAVFHIDYDSNNLLMLDNNSASTQKMFFASQGATHAQIYGTTSSGAVTIESDPSNNHGSSLINFKVDTVEQMVINNSGVGIGTATSSGGLHIYRPDAQIRLYDTTTSGSQTAFRLMAYNGLTYIQSGTAFSSDSKAPIVFSSMFAGTEWLRIATNGNIYTNGNTSLPTGSTSGFGFSQDQFYISYTGTSANYIQRFYNANGLIGSILANGSATAFNTSSDYRLKENEVAISDGITRLKTLKPYRFNFKTDPSKTVDGFFAHEVTAVPEAIAGEKDGTEMQGIDQSKLVPLLTAALQEAIAEIETLKADVAALKSS